MKRKICIKSTNLDLLEFLKKYDEFDNFIIKNNWIIFNGIKENTNLLELSNLLENDFSISLKIIFTSFTTSENLDLILYYCNNDALLQAKVNNLSELILNDLIIGNEEVVQIMRKKIKNIPNHIYDNIMQLINNDLNVKLTSEKTYVHRNTLINHINRFSEISTLNPTNVIDAFIIYYFKEYYEIR